MEALLQELYAASARLQEAHHIAKREGRQDVADEIRCAGDAVALAVGRLVKNRSRAERHEALEKVVLS